MTEFWAFVGKFIGEMGFTHIGSGWYSNHDDSVRIRLWKDNEVDFWKWSPSEDYREVVFRGKLYNQTEYEFVLNRVFEKWKQ